MAFIIRFWVFGGDGALLSIFGLLALVVIVICVFIVRVYRFVGFVIDNAVIGVAGTVSAG